MTDAALQAARERHEANQLEAVIQRVSAQNQGSKDGMSTHVSVDIQRLLDAVDKATATYAQTLELWAAEEVRRWKLTFYVAELEKFANPAQRAKAVELAQKAFDDVHTDDYWPNENALEMER